MTALREICFYCCWVRWS